nr:capsule assembly Wzi family protein [Klebsiella pneumoniae]
MNQYTVPHTKIIGGRFTFTPFQSLELVLRALCSGGEGRPESFQQFLGWFYWKRYTGTDNEPGKPAGRI